jgi:NAD(P)-dependent dehydrogenase (short-subunit alcohol dehydrogenase family)
MEVDDLNMTRRGYGRTQAYAQSKLANILFTKELARRIKGIF